MVYVALATDTVLVTASVVLATDTVLATASVVLAMAAVLDMDAVLDTDTVLASDMVLVPAVATVAMVATELAMDVASASAVLDLDMASASARLASAPDTPGMLVLAITVLTPMVSKLRAHAPSVLVLLVHAVWVSVKPVCLPLVPSAATVLRLASVSVLLMAKNGE